MSDGYYNFVSTRVENKELPDQKKIFSGAWCFDSRESLIEANKKSINESDASGNWPLIIAAYMGHTKILELLLKNGAELSVLDPSMNATALHAAAYAGRSTSAKLLIEYGIGEF